MKLANQLPSCCKAPIDEMMVVQIRDILNEIKGAFVPTFEQPAVSTHYLVSEYHKREDKPMDINGSCAEFCLAYQTEEEKQAETVTE